MWNRKLPSRDGTPTRSAGIAFSKLVHYGYGGLLLSDRRPSVADPNSARKGHRAWVGYRISSLPQPTRTVMFADSTRRIVGRLLPQKDILPSIDVAFRDGAARAAASPRVHGRHSGNASSPRTAQPLSRSPWPTSCWPQSRPAARRSSTP
ncbi:MAG: hypothetical protein AAFX79_12050 [Planctomycetota bacterium]